MIVDNHSLSCVQGSRDSSVKSSLLVDYISLSDHDLLHLPVGIACAGLDLVAVLPRVGKVNRRLSYDCKMKMNKMSVLASSTNRKCDMQLLYNSTESGE